MKMCASRCRRNWRPSLRRRAADEFAAGCSGHREVFAIRGGVRGGVFWVACSSVACRVNGTYNKRSQTLAVKIVRQPNKIALIGAPSSAAAFSAGSEKAPAALRAAGIAEKLRAIGYEVTDYGDCAPRLFADDEEHKRARNLAEIVAGLNDLKTPASTPSGRIDGMVVAHIIGKGAPELVRFWSDAPLVREPDVTLFGLERIDPPEQEFLARSPMRHMDAADILLKGAAKAAHDALVQVHADAREFVLHLDTDVIAQEDYPAVNVPGSGGLGLDDVRTAFVEFAKQKNLLGLDVAQYNPDKDPDGSGAGKLVDILVEALSARLEALTAPAADTAAGSAEVSSSETSA